MAIFRALGVNSETERQKDDFYSTDPKAVESLIKFLKDNNIEIPYQIVESSVGMGHIAKVFEDEGHNVTGYDIIDRGWHDTIVADYLLVDRLPECCNNGCMIVENTPFKHSVEFISHGMDLINDGDYICSLQKIQFLESERRKEFFEKYPPKYVCVFSKRTNTYRDGAMDKYKSSTMCFAWFIFQKGYNGATLVKWI